MCNEVFANVLFHVTCVCGHPEILHKGLAKNRWLRYGYYGLDVVRIF